ncbi:MAG TPA: VTT domain-containing protein [Acidobacteriaceae bacterium]|nr:VTT domain-containing protein [Acidobacteriaceae bacterium]
MSLHLSDAFRSKFIQAAHHAVHGSAGSKSHLLRWLMSFGALGLFLVAAIDASVIPLALPGSADLLLLLLVSQRGSTVISAVWLVFSALTGSTLGGYLAWSVGRKGGEVTLERYIPQRYLARIRGWVERRGFWTIAIAAILPPPIPLTPVVVAAGALQVPCSRFLSAFALARLVRYTFLAWLGLSYGRHIVRLWQQTLSGWGHTVLWTYCGLLAAGILFGFWKYRSAQNKTASQPA